MGRNETSKASYHAKKHKRSKMRHHIIAAAASAAAIVATQVRPAPVPVRTSVLTGRMWVKELLESPVRMHEQLGVPRHVFEKLLDELQSAHGLADGKYITAKEQLAIFLHLARTGASSRMLQERFQRSGSTISMYV